MVGYDGFDTIIYPEDVIEDEQNYFDDLSDQCVDAMIEPAADDLVKILTISYMILRMEN